MYVSSQEGYTDVAVIRITLFFLFFFVFVRDDLHHNFQNRRNAPSYTLQDILLRMKYKEPLTTAMDRVPVPATKDAYEYTPGHQAGYVVVEFGEFLMKFLQRIF